MQKTLHKLRDVYGVSREIPLNYVEREDVDKAFVNNPTRDKHLVIYGSSKQGKTLLRKHCLKEEDCIVISCLSSMDLSALHGAILKSAGYQIERSNKRTVGGHHKYTLEFRGEGKVPFVGSLGGAGTIEGANKSEEHTEYSKIEIDL